MATKMCVSAALVVFIVCLIGGISADDPSTRKVTFKFNPDCNRPECKEGFNGSISNVVMVTAANAENTIYYVVSNIGVPTVLMLKTKPSATLSFDWDKLLSNDSSEFTDGSIKVQPPNSVLYSSALVFTRLIEYNDTDDAANVTHYAWNETAWNVHQFADFTWKLAAPVKDDASSVVLNATVMVPMNRTVNESSDGLDYDVEEEVPKPPHSLGFVSFVFHMYGDNGRADELPHMMHGDNDTQLDFIIAFNSTFPNSRFGLEAAMFSDVKGEMNLNEVQSLDDEYTPGIFRTMNWLSTKGDDAKQSESCYLQWRRVSYQQADRSRSVATGINTGDPVAVTSASEPLTSSLAYAFFGKELTTITNGALNISFGLSQDGFYAKTNYTAWASLYGIGTPYADTMSILVISIISAGLGIPVVIILLGTIWRACKGRSSSSSPYQVINGDVSPTTYSPAINT